MTTFTEENKIEDVAAIQTFRYACKVFNWKEFSFKKGKKGLNFFLHVSAFKSVYLCFPFSKSYNPFFHVLKFATAYRYISMSITKTT